MNTRTRVRSPAETQVGKSGVEVELRAIDVNDDGKASITRDRDDMIAHGEANTSGAKLLPSEADEGTK